MKTRNLRLQKKFFEKRVIFERKIWWCYIWKNFDKNREIMLFFLKKIKNKIQFFTVNNQNFFKKYLLNVSKKFDKSKNFYENELNFSLSAIKISWNKIAAYCNILWKWIINCNLSDCEKIFWIRVYKLVRCSYIDRLEKLNVSPPWTASNTSYGFLLSLISVTCLVHQWGYHPFTYDQLYFPRCNLVKNVSKRKFKIKITPIEEHKES